VPDGARPESRSPGPKGRRAARTAAVAAASALLALGPALFLFDFTVDDALIPARYAHHLSTGRGYVFNAGGPRTDGVTPLGYAHLLAPFAREGAMQALAASRAIGLVAWLAGAAAIGWRIAALGGSPLRFASLLLLVGSAPLAAWASAGLETGLVAGLATLGVCLRHAGRSEPAGVLLLGIAAGMRPELLPFAVVAGVPSSLPREEVASLVPRWAHLGRLLLVVAPFVIVVTVRVVTFGRPTPLAALAKQSSLEAGLTYAAACFLLCGPIGVLAPWTWRRVGAYAKWLLGAIAIHFVAVAFAGGDWMPLSRLVVPVLPATILVVAEIGATGSRAALAPLGIAVLLQCWVWREPGLRSRRVMADRHVVIDEATPALAGARVVGTLDVGWVGAAAPGATIVDFAGVTDPVVAALPGGHTSKPIPDELLIQRDVDALVLLLAGDAPPEADWTRSRFSRGVERWIALSPVIAERFEPRLVTSGRLRYLILRRR
jgi:hypothetical protein